MQVKVCKNCRRLFKYIYGPELCPECSEIFMEEPEQKMTQEADIFADGRSSLSLRPLVKEEEAKYEQIKDYILAHPKATVAQIAQENDVTPSKLFEWIREERLEFSDDCEYAWFRCEMCGIKIKSGRLCSSCKTKK
jgi:uncharacterized protein